MIRSSLRLLLLIGFLSLTGWSLAKTASLPFKLKPFAAARPPSNSPPTRTVQEVVQTVGPAAEKALKPAFAAAKVPYPPREVAFLAFKREKRLELWARQAQPWVFIQEFPILAASGGSGPKLKEGDRQVPEGIYRVEGLNPNSRYHLSLKLNYPNAFDLAQARHDKRENVGSDIFIHGRAVSIGCLAMGDPVSEQLFVLAARVGVGQVKVIIAPRDFRKEPWTAEPEPDPSWLPTLYRDLDAALAPFAVP